MTTHTVSCLSRISTKLHTLKPFISLYEMFDLKKSASLKQFAEQASPKDTLTDRG